MTSSPHPPTAAPRRHRGRARRAPRARDRGRGRTPTPQEDGQAARDHLVTPMHVASAQTLDDPRPATSAAAATRTPSSSSATAARPSSSRPTIGTTKLLRVDACPRSSRRRCATEHGAPVADPLPPARPRQRSSASASPTTLSARRSSAPSSRRRPADAGAVDRARRRLRRRRRQERVDTDDDNDLLSDTLENCAARLDPCKADTDGDGVEDGYEYQSALDLNDDEYQSRTTYLPVPGQAAVPEPARPTDADIDYDGDALTLGEEYELWKYTIARRHAARLDAADATRTASSTRSTTATADGHRRPALPRPTGYDKQAEFVSWADRHRLRPRSRSPDGTGRPAATLDHDGTASSLVRRRPRRAGAATAPSTTLLRPRRRRLPLRRRARRGRRRPHELRRDPRPHDAPATGARCYASETPYPSLRRHEPRRRRHRRRRRARRRRRPGPRRHPEPRWSCSRNAATRSPDRSTVRATRTPPKPVARRLRPRQPVQPVPAERQRPDVHPSPRGLRRSTAAPFDGSPDYLVLN